MYVFEPLYKVDFFEAFVSIVNATAAFAQADPAANATAAKMQGAPTIVSGGSSKTNEKDEKYHKLVKYLDQDLIRQRINDEGMVTITLCENLAKKKKVRKGYYYVEVQAKQFQKGPKEEVQIKNFREKVEFPDDAQDDIDRIIRSELIKLKNLKKIEERHQKRLPPAFQD